MKNSIAMRRHTYGNALRDCIKVQSNIRSNLMRRAARNKRKHPVLNELPYIDHRQHEYNKVEYLEFVFELCQ